MKYVNFWNALTIAVTLLSAAVPSSALAEGKKSGGGSGSAREKVMLDSYLRENSIRKNSPEIKDCVRPVLHWVKSKLPEYGARLESYLTSKRMVLVDDAILEQLAKENPSIKHRYGDQLVMVNEARHPFIWVGRGFYTGPEMQDPKRRCDAVLHEVLVSDKLEYPSNTTITELTEKEKDQVIALGILLQEEAEDNEMSSRELASILLNKFNMHIGATAEQLISLQVEIFGHLRNMKRVCDANTSSLVPTEIGTAEFGPSGKFRELWQLAYRLQELGRAYGTGAYDELPVYTALMSLASQVGLNVRKRNGKSESATEFAATSVDPAHVRAYRDDTWNFLFAGSLVCGNVFNMNSASQVILDGRVIKKPDEKMGQVDNPKTGVRGQ